MAKEAMWVLEDGTVEGLCYKELVILFIQHHCEGCVGASR